MRILNIQYEMQLAFDGPVTDHYFRFRCLPAEDGAQTVEALERTVDPAGAVHERTDGFGNRMCYGEILTPHDSLCVQMNARVRVERNAVREERKSGAAACGRTDPGTSVYSAGKTETADRKMRKTGVRGAVFGTADDLSGLTAGQAPWIAYRYPSELTKPDKAMRDWFSVLRKKYVSGSGPAAEDIINGGASREICGRLGTRFPEYLMHEVYQRLCYAQGQTHVGTTAAEAFALGRGVCQDYAHIYVALCRMAGFPARYAAGMAVGEGATHAWAEVWQDEAWTAYDPTHDCIVDDRYVKLSHGRDFADCSVDRGCFRGASGQKQTVYVKVEDCTADRKS